MVKYCKEKYPKGTWKGQKTDGRYMDGWLYNNLELLAEKIVKDMTFLAIIYSSTLEVGTGKSVLATQIGEAWKEIMKNKHNIDLPYGIDNIVWRPKELIDRAFNVPKYSFLLLDEWEDSTYWSELGITLRQFFRKCRQLNLFMVCIIPNWFQLPISYAVSRSIFAIDVKFDDKLNRGLFSFYNFPAKRKLYVIGKRNHNYFVTKPTFNGLFQDGYGVDEKEYRKKKYEDMLKYDDEKPLRKSSSVIEKETKIKMMNFMIKNEPKLTLKELAGRLGVTKRTINHWKRGGVADRERTEKAYILNLMNKNDEKDVVMNEEKLQNYEKTREESDNE